ncbi:MAG: type III polyketide synthase [Planctomycetaceae bacterium]|nr:type III polyketide synthase [Planctomycetales bacterium]MCB9924492.1 type III polyketide synthase [Planctomycetaceae bacterium]
MNASILGLGTALPEHVFTQEEALAFSTDLVCRDERETRLIRTMIRKSGVETRRTCVHHRRAHEWIEPDAPPSSSPGPTTKQRMAMYAEQSRPLAMAAAEQALERAGLTGNAITHLVTVSCTGFDAPGVDIHLFDELGLPDTTQRVNVGFMGCHGGINGLRTARGLAAADPDARILLCAVELCSLHYKFQWEPDFMLGNVLFADGAAAVVVSPESVGDGRIASLRDTASCLLKDSRETITWQVGDAGFEMSLSNRVPGLILEQLRPWLSSWLESKGHSLDTIDLWAVHPGGPKILDAVEQALGLGPEALSNSRTVLNEYGNMSSPTVFFVLERFLQQREIGPCVMLGFGPGLVAEVALLE